MLGNNEIFQKRHPGEQPDVLERAGDARLLGDAKFLESLEQKRLAAGMCELQPPNAWLVEAGDAIEQRSLAGPVRADKRGDLPFCGIEAEVAYGGQPAETHGEVFHLEDRRRAHAGPRLCVLSTASVGMSRRRCNDTEALRVDTNPRGR